VSTSRVAAIGQDQRKLATLPKLFGARFFQSRRRDAKKVRIFYHRGILIVLSLVCPNSPPTRAPMQAAPARFRARRKTAGGDGGNIKSSQELKVQNDEILKQQQAASRSS